jgi:hypothetical protein
MLNTISNINRKADKQGNVHLISFLGATLSRLAYQDDNKFLTSYSKIMGPVIQPKILQGINEVSSSNLSQLTDDQTIFGLDKSSSDIFANYELQFQGKNYIDFIKLQMPQNVNIINGDMTGTMNIPVPGEPTAQDMVKYISIGWSNYGEIYIVADKRMPNTIFLIFRGTYSSKTASLYSKPTSLIPLTVCKDSNGTPDTFLYGIFKASTEMIHTIIQSMSYLASNFLGATQPNSVKIFTTGHSLGGAMCTNFAYLWMGVKKTPPYNAAPYNVLADNIVCISLGAPRCMGQNVAKKFCDFVSQNKILYLRITTRGDPVPALPPKTGFIHPCSDNPKMRQEISEDCNATLTMRPVPKIDYTQNLDCQNYKTRAFVPNPLSHTVYLDIMYTKAVDIKKFFTSAVLAKEVLRINGDTVCRLIMGQLANYKVIFFNVNKARETPSNLDAQFDAQLSKENSQTEISSNGTVGGWSLLGKKSPPVSQGAQQQKNLTSSSLSMPKIGGKVVEDVRMTQEAFNSLISQMVNLSEDLCPQKGKMVDPFNQQMMSDLSCPGNKFGGKKSINRSKRYKKLKKSIKSKKKRSTRNY